MKLLQWPDMQKPREKLIQKGAQALTDVELLAVFLGTGIKDISVIDLSAALLQQFGSLHGLLSANKPTLCAIHGVGVAKFAQMQAILEISKRYFTENLHSKSAIECASDTRLFLLSQLRDEPNEVFAIMLLNSQHQLIAFEKVFFGTINCANVHPRVLLQRALANNAAAMILAHNHPSGIAEPSQADRQITRHIVQAMSLVDIKVLDHFVIGAGYTVSFAQRGWM